jgi:hypothetical protein
MQGFLDIRPLGGFTAGVPDDLGVDGIGGRMPLSPGKQPGLRLTTQTAIVVAQFDQQVRAEHDIAILATLASLDMDHHALAVDVSKLELSQLGSPHPGSVQRGQDSVMERAGGSLDQTGNFVLA